MKIKKKKSSLKNLLILFLILALCTPFASAALVYAEDGGDAESAEETVSEEDADKSSDDVTEPPPGEDSAPVPDTPLEELFTFTFVLEGTSFQLPFPLADLLNDGWDFAEDYETEYLSSPDEISYTVNLMKGNKKIKTQLCSFSNEKTKYADAQVVLLDVSKPYDTEEAVDLVLPGGVTLYTKRNELKEWYGEPNYTQDALWVYGVSGRYSLSVSVWDEEVGVEHITIQRMSPVFTPEDVDGVDAVLPPDVAEYIPAEAISDKLADMTFSIDGKVMRLPVPLSEFLLDGWSVISTNLPYTQMEPYDTARVILRKGNALLSLKVHNSSFTEKTALENCTVLELQDRMREGIQDRNHLTIAQNVATGSDRKEVILLLIDLKPDISVSGNSEKYTVRCNNYLYTIYIDDGIVTQIMLEDY